MFFSCISCSCCLSVSQLDRTHRHKSAHPHTKNAFYGRKGHSLKPRQANLWLQPQVKSSFAYFPTRRPRNCSVIPRDRCCTPLTFKVSPHFENRLVTQSGSHNLPNKIHMTVQEATPREENASVQSRLLQTMLGHKRVCAEVSLEERAALKSKKKFPNPPNEALWNICLASRPNISWRFVVRQRALQECFLNIANGQTTCCRHKSPIPILKSLVPGLLRENRDLQRPSAHSTDIIETSITSSDRNVF